MAKAELGDKQVCPQCSSKFYDLRRRPAHCPKCHYEFDPDDENVRIRRVKTRTPNYDARFEEEEAKPEPDEELEEELEAAPELDAEPPEDGEILTDDEEDPVEGPDALPPGFSEDDVEIEDAPGDDDDLPILEEDEADFPEEELGEIAEGDDDEESDRT